MVEIYLPGSRQRMELQAALAHEFEEEKVRAHVHYEEDEAEIPLPKTCDVKDALIARLQEHDTKIGMLVKSNKLIKEELADDRDMGNYIKENEEIIRRTMDQILRILNAFMEAGIDLDKEGVLLKMPHRHSYMPEDMAGHDCSKHDGH